jgi:NAD(P)-dependent dehydrogenase (short-subunit alcohol dehydrogenase family)
MAEERRVAVVSGAGRGIGAEIARQLAGEHGFLVLAGARDPDVVKGGENIMPVRLDVIDQAGISELAARAGEDPGRLDVLVNNAGIYGEATGAMDYPLDAAHDVLETNLFGAWRLIQVFAPLLRRSHDPRIVNVSSGAGQLDDMYGGQTAYRLSKTALNALTRTLAQDEEWLRVNSLCPGWVRTDMGGPGAPRSVSEGADTAVWLATDPEVGSGGFYRDRAPIPW